MNDLQTLSVTERGDAVVVELDRPHSRNAINATMVSELHRVCQQLEQQPRILIITGTAGHFAAGADIAELVQRGRDEALAGINRTVFDRIARLPALTIAAVEGSALGGGAELAYACDVRIAGADARFGNPETGLGILAAAGAAYRLADLVGKSVAKQVILAGKILGAEEALRHGLVVDVVAAGTSLDAALTLAKQVAERSALAQRLSKAVIDAQAAHPMIDDIAQAILFESSDKTERMHRFLGTS